MFGKKIKQERQQLQFIKEQLDEICPKVDISNMYVWEENKVFNLVILHENDIIGENIFGHIVKGFESILTDVFTDKVIYRKTSIRKIECEEFLGNEKYGYLYPVYKADKNLLAYTDKKVPVYVLQQLFYRLNKVDVNAKILKKLK